MGCVQVLTIKNSSVMNMFLFKVFIFSVYPGVEMLDRMVAFFLSFLRSFCTIFHSGSTNYIPTNSVGGFPFLHILSSIYYL